MATTPAQLVKVEVKGTQLLNPFRAQVIELSIETEEDYQAADVLLGRIGGAIKTWDGEMEPILSPLRQAKTAADKLKAKVMKPLEGLYAQVRASMTDYKREEARQIAEAQRVEDAAKAKVNAQIEKVATQELAAKTNQMRERLAQKRQELEEKAEEIEEAPKPVEGTHSQTRTVKKWRMTDLREVCASVAGHFDCAELSYDGPNQVPEEAVIINSVYINKLSTQPGGWETIASWQGFEVYEDVLVAGRGVR